MPRPRGFLSWVCLTWSLQFGFEQYWEGSDDGILMATEAESCWQLLLAWGEVPR